MHQNDLRNGSFCGQQDHLSKEQMHFHQLRKAPAEWHHLEGKTVITWDWLKQKFANVIREWRTYITSSFSVHATKMLRSSCCSLCKNRGPTPDVKDRHTGLSLFFWLRPTWVSSVQNKVMTLCPQHLIILDRRDVVSRL